MREVSSKNSPSIHVLCDALARSDSVNISVKSLESYADQVESALRTSLANRRGTQITESMLQAAFKEAHELLRSSELGQSAQLAISAMVIIEQGDNNSKILAGTVGDLLLYRTTPDHTGLLFHDALNTGPLGADTGARFEHLRNALGYSVDPHVTMGQFSRHKQEAWTLLSYGVASQLSGTQVRCLGLDPSNHSTGIAATLRQLGEQTHLYRATPIGRGVLCTRSNEAREIYQLYSRAGRRSRLSSWAAAAAAAIVVMTGVDIHALSSEKHSSKQSGLESLEAWNANQNAILPEYLARNRSKARVTQNAEAISSETPATSSCIDSPLNDRIAILRQKAARLQSEQETTAAIAGELERLQSEISSRDALIAELAEGQELLESLAQDLGTGADSSSSQSDLIRQRVRQLSTELEERTHLVGELNAARNKLLEDLAATKDHASLLEERVDTTEAERKSIEKKLASLSELRETEMHDQANTLAIMEADFGTRIETLREKLEESAIHLEEARTLVLNKEMEIANLTLEQENLDQTLTVTRKKLHLFEKGLFAIDQLAERVDEKATELSDLAIQQDELRLEISEIIVAHESLKNTVEETAKTDGETLDKLLKFADHLSSRFGELETTLSQNSKTCTEQFQATGNQVLELEEQLSTRIQGLETGLAEQNERSVASQQTSNQEILELSDQLTSRLANLENDRITSQDIITLSEKITSHLTEIKSGLSKQGETSAQEILNLSEQLTNRLVNLEDDQVTSQDIFELSEKLSSRLGGLELSLAEQSKHNTEAQEANAHEILSLSEQLTNRLVNLEGDQVTSQDILELATTLSGRMVELELSLTEHSKQSLDSQQANAQETLDLTEQLTSRLARLEDSQITNQDILELSATVFSRMGGLELILSEQSKNSLKAQQANAQETLDLAEQLTSRLVNLEADQVTSQDILELATKLTSRLESLELSLAEQRKHSQETQEANAQEILDLSKQLTTSMESLKTDRVSSQDILELSENIYSHLEGLGLSLAEQSKHSQETQEANAQEILNLSKELTSRIGSLETDLAEKSNESQELSLTNNRQILEVAEKVDLHVGRLGSGLVAQAKQSEESRQDFQHKIAQLAETLGQRISGFEVELTAQSHQYSQEQQARGTELVELSQRLSTRIGKLESNFSLHAEQSDKEDQEARGTVAGLADSLNQRISKLETTLSTQVDQEATNAYQDRVELAKQTKSLGSRLNQIQETQDISFTYTREIIEELKEELLSKSALISGLEVRSDVRDRNMEALAIGQQLLQSTIDDGSRHTAELSEQVCGLQGLGKRVDEIARYLGAVDELSQELANKDKALHTLQKQYTSLKGAWDESQRYLEQVEGLTARTETLETIAKRSQSELQSIDTAQRDLSDWLEDQQGQLYGLDSKVADVAEKRPSNDHEIAVLNSSLKDTQHQLGSQLQEHDQILRELQQLVRVLDKRGANTVGSDQLAIIEASVDKLNRQVERNRESTNESDLHRKTLAADVRASREALSTLESQRSELKKMESRLRTREQMLTDLSRSHETVESLLRATQTKVALLQKETERSQSMREDLREGESLVKAIHQAQDTLIVDVTTSKRKLNSLERRFESVAAIEEKLREKDTLIANLNHSQRNLEARLDSSANKISYLEKQLSTLEKIDRDVANIRHQMSKIQ